MSRRTRYQQGSVQREKRLSGSDVWIYRWYETGTENKGRKAFSTRATYECYLKLWILPRWGELRIDQVKSVAVEEWLHSIKRSKGTRAKIRNIMSGIFHHAMRYEGLTATRSSLCAKARNGSTPDLFELAELQLLLSWRRHSRLKLLQPR